MISSQGNFGDSHGNIMKERLDNVELSSDLQLSSFEEKRSDLIKMFYEMYGNVQTVEDVDKVKAALTECNHAILESKGKTSRRSSETTFINSITSRRGKDSVTAKEKRKKRKF